MLELVDTKYQDLAYEEVKTEKKDIYGIMARIAFFMVIFFNIFGTSLPFRERVLDVSEVGTSNIINQLVFPTMFFVALIALIPKFRVLGAFMLKEKYLYLFLLWAGLSILWSDYSFVAFKRWFQFFALITAISAALLYIKTDKEILAYFKPITAIYIIFSFVSIFTIPGALDDYGVWRGAAASKNHLGQAALVCLMVWVFSLKGSTIPQKIFAFIVIGISGVLLFGSESSTSMFAFFILCMVGFFFFIDNQFKKIGAGRFLSFIIISAILTFIIYAFVATPQLVNTFLGNFGEDITFTGRTWLWEDVFNEAKKHIWLGTGYQSYWVITSNEILKLYEVYTWLPKQAHNGYIDLINELGIIGAVLFLMMIVSFFINVKRLREPQIWSWFIVTVLIINLQESTLFHGGILTGSIFMFGYLAVIMRKFNQDKDQTAEIYQTDESDT